MWVKKNYKLISDIHGQLTFLAFMDNLKKLSLNHLWVKKIENFKKEEELLGLWLL